MAPEDAKELTSSGAVTLVNRVLEGLVAARPGRYTLYLVRPDSAPLLAEGERYRDLLRQAKDALILTGWGDPEPLLRAQAGARGRRYGQARAWWATVVMGPHLSMAAVARVAEDGSPAHGFLTEDPAAVRRIAAIIQAAAADPQTELLAV
jgi:hypothetical protein